MTAPDDRWLRWHEAYDDPTSAQTRRLKLVQEQIRLMLDVAPTGPIRALSRVLGRAETSSRCCVITRAGPVVARLVELDPHLAAVSRASAEAIHGARIDVVEADAGTSDAAAGTAPVSLLLLAGIFGNVPDLDIERTAQAMPMLCAAGATADLQLEPPSAGPHADNPALVHVRGRRRNDLHRTAV